MSVQRKLTYTQVKGKFEEIRKIARDTTLESLPPFLSNKHNAIISTSDIGFHGFTLDTKVELKNGKVMILVA